MSTIFHFLTRATRELMDNHNSSIATRISITSFLALTLASIIYGGGAVMRPSTQEESPTESQVLQKISAILAEGRFWGNLSIDQKELKATLFLAIDKADKSEFDVLVVVPEIQWTFELRTCAQEPPILVEGWGASVQKPDAEGYLASQVRRYSSFVENARKAERRIAIETEPAILFNADTAFKKRRIGQIESALGDLLHKHGSRIKIANFSRLTDQIDVLVPSVDAIITMSVVHASCGQDIVEIGREHRLKDIRPELRRKIEQNGESVITN
jgi:hypothetical protein